MPVEEKNSIGAWVDGDEQAGDEILVPRRHAGAAFAAAALHAIFGQRRALDIAGMGDGDGHILALDQRFVFDFDFGVDQFGLARRGELVADRVEFVRDDLQARGARDAGCRDNPGSPRPAWWLRRRFRRGPARSGAAGADPGSPWPAPRSGGWCRLPPSRWRGSAISATSGPTSLAGQARAINCSRAVAASAAARISCDHFVDIGDGDGQADQDMAAVARLGEFELGAPGDDFLAEGDEGADQLLQIHLHADGPRSAPAC